MLERGESEECKDNKNSPCSSASHSLSACMFHKPLFPHRTYFNFHSTSQYKREVSSIFWILICLGRIITFFTLPFHYNNNSYVLFSFRPAEISGWVANIFWIFTYPVIISTTLETECSPWSAELTQSCKRQERAEIYLHPVATFALNTLLTIYFGWKDLREWQRLSNGDVRCLLVFSSQSCLSEEKELASAGI